MDGRLKTKIFMIMLVFMVLLVAPFAEVLAQDIHKQKPAPPAAKFVLGHSMAVTGPASDEAFGLQGAKDYITWLNEKGGIHGVPVEHLWGDNKYQTPLALNFYRRFKEKGNLVHYTGISGAEAALRESYAKDKIPCIPASFAKEQIDPPGWIFSPICDYSDATAGAGIWFMKEWKQKGKTERAKLCMVYPDNTYGRSALHAIKYLASIGMDVVGEFVVPWNPIDTTAIAQGVMTKNPDLIFLMHHAGGAAVIAKDMRKVGLTPKVPLIGVWYILDSTTIKLAGEAGDGMMSVSPYGLSTEDKPGLKEMANWYADIHGTKEIASYPYYSCGYIYAKLGTDAIRMAYERVGWPVTGQDVYNVLASLKDYDMGGLTFPVTFTGTGPTSRRGSSSVRILQLQKGKLDPIADWFKVPFVRLDGTWIE